MHPKSTESTDKKKPGCLGRLLRLGFVIAAIAFIGFVAASMLGGGDDGEMPSACKVAPAEIVNEISNGMGTIPTGLNDGVTIDNAYMVRAEDRTNVWYVGAQLHGGALDDDTNVGVWATSRIDADGVYTGEGAILSVGGFAEEFSDWPDGDLPGDNDDLSITDDAARAVQDCVD